MRRAKLIEREHRLVAQREVVPAAAVANDACLQCEETAPLDHLLCAGRVDGDDVASLILAEPRAVPLQLALIREESCR